MTTYYQDGAVRVTDTAVEVGTRVFSIAELTYVWHERGRPTLRTTSRRLGRWALIAVLTLPVVAGAVVVANLIAAESGLGARLGIAAVLVLLGMILLMLLSPVIEFPMMALERSYDRGTDVRELWVHWRDQDLMVLRTTDAARFGRIYRAIQRAIERSEG